MNTNLTDNNLSYPKKKASGGIGYLLIAIIGFVFMGYVILKFGGATNPVTKGKAEKRGKAYLEENYPGVYERVNTQNSGNAYEDQDGNWVIQYFSREKNNELFSKIKYSFVLMFDKDLNLITDGYREYYLRGGSVYSNYSTDFYRDVYNLLGSPYGNQPIQIAGDYLERLDDYDFENVAFYEAGDYLVYTGDYLDPEKEYDANELYAKYGCVYLKFFMESGGYEDYEEAVKSAAAILKENNMPYNTMHVYMWFRDSDIIFCDGEFTMEEFDTDIDTVLPDKTFVFTQAEYDRRKATGEEIPTIEVGSLSDLLEHVGE